MTNDLTVHGIFPTPIAESTIDLPDISHIVWEQQSTGIEQSEAELHQKAVMQEFCDTIVKKAEEFSKQIGWRDEKLWITQMWANRYTPVEGKEGGSIKAHFHSNSLLSGVVYFTDSSPTRFFKHDKTPTLIQTKNENTTPFITEIFTVDAIKGRLVFFPSYLIHDSQPCDKERITISFNLLPTQLGTRLDYNFVDLSNCKS